MNLYIFQGFEKQPFFPLGFMSIKGNNLEIRQTAFSYIQAVSNDRTVSIDLTNLKSGEIHHIYWGNEGVVSTFTDKEPEFYSKFYNSYKAVYITVFKDSRQHIYVYTRVGYVQYDETTEDNPQDYLVSLYSVGVTEDRTVFKALKTFIGEIATSESVLEYINACKVQDKKVEYYTKFNSFTESKKSYNVQLDVLVLLLKEILEDNELKNRITSKYPQLLEYLDSMASHSSLSYLDDNYIEECLKRKYLEASLQKNYMREFQKLDD